MVTWQPGVLWCNPFLIGTMLMVLVWQILKSMHWDKFMELPYGSVYSYTVLMTMLWMVVLFQPTGFAPFVYGQF